MIPKINHFALTNHTMIHDEEAVTTLELMGRIANTINDCIAQINAHTETLEKELKKLPGYAAESVTDNIENGSIGALINSYLLNQLDMDIQELNERIDNLLINGTSTENNSELIDARANYTTLGNRLNALRDGTGFLDAVKPGTVEAERIMVGMLGGDIKKEKTVPLALGFAGDWDGGKAYYDRDTLEKIDHASYTLSYPILCEYGDVFKVDSYLFGNKVYPAVLFDQYHNPLKVLGIPGAGDWEKKEQFITVDQPNAKYIRFICGNGEIANFRARKIKWWDGFDALAYSRGYVHMHAKNRTNTVTDRAQIKFWLPFEARSIELFPGKLENVKGWTYRIFGASSNSTNEYQLEESAAGYTYDINEGIIINAKTTVSENDGVKFTHFCVFVDFIAEDPDQYMEASIILPEGAENPSLHGHLDSDYLNIVAPGAAGSPLYQKRILGLGDSLMAGNTLRKEFSWFNIAAGSRDMVHFNAAVNGMSVGGSPSGSPSIAGSIDSILEQFPQPDYVILQGGANDLRLGNSLSGIQSVMDVLHNKILANNPKAKILFMSNWQRSNYVTPAGDNEYDYVAEMIIACERLHIPYINNYTDGLSITHQYVKTWADEGIVSGGEANIHFSKEANRYIAPQVVSKLEGI